MAEGLLSQCKVGFIHDGCFIVSVVMSVSGWFSGRFLAKRSQISIISSQVEFGNLS